MARKPLSVALAFSLTLWMTSWPATMNGAETGTGARGERFAGLELAEALQVLQRQGLPLVFSSAVVRPSMVVEAEPLGGSPRQVLDELLRPHGLAVANGPRGRLVVVRTSPAKTTSDTEPAGGPAALSMTSDEITVTRAANESRHGEPVAAAALDLPIEHDQPHLGSDAFRAVALLPEAATTDTSSQLSIRGGRREDVMILLDGVELLAPYHLQDFDSALGIVPAGSLERVELISDPVPVEYGDRMGGVVDMRSRTPAGPLGMSVGVGSFFAEGSASRAFAADRGRWLAAGRAGNYRLALEADGRHQDPRYWDLFGKVDYAIGSNQSFQLRLLLAEDEFDVDDRRAGGGKYSSRWGNSYLWLGHVAALGTSAMAESLVWAGRLERVRTGERAVQGSTQFDLDDSRGLDLTGAKSVWRWAPASERWSLDGGVELRQLRSSIDYRAHRQDSELPLPGTTPASGDSQFSGDFDFEQLGWFASGRVRAGRAITVEAGLRWDHTGLTDEHHFSPRLHLAWRPDESAVVRAAWGHFYQSQRPYELQVEDGQTAIWPAERAVQSLLSYERRLAGGGSWRVGAYRRLEDRPRPRYESLFDAAVLYPELAPGRVRLEPDAGRTTGVEVVFQGAPRPRLSWSAAYTYASVADHVAGRWVPRTTDEPHAVQLTGHLRLPHDWTLSAAWLYHTGWPTTSVAARVVTDGEGNAGVEPVLGPVRGDRLGDYHRLDVRLGHDWELARGRLGAYLDLQNLYDRENDRGFEGFRLQLANDGQPTVSAEPSSWGGFLPSIGLRWSF